MTPTPLDSTILDAPVEGRNLRPGSLRDQLGRRPTLLVFLRHLGCLFSREWLAEVQAAVASDPSFPAVLYVHLGTPEQGDAFFEPSTPDARAMADPNRFYYKALGVPSASPLQLFDPRLWACGMRATRRGHKQGKPVGDPLVKPALVLVEGNQVAWKFIPDQMGGLPALADIPRPVVV
jgi:hypothetical protein